MLKIIENYLIKFSKKLDINSFRVKLGKFIKFQLVINLLLILKKIPGNKFYKNSLNNFFVLSDVFLLSLVNWFLELTFLLQNFFLWRKLNEMKDFVLKMQWSFFYDIFNKKIYQIFFVKLLLKTCVKLTHF